MKQITKNAKPKRLVQWEQENIPLGMGYKQLHGDVKTDLHHALLAEQGAICCYCEQRIDSSNSHIEHFRPQNHDPQLALDYQNLLCSCQLPHAQKKTPKEPRHCGILKENWFSDSLISPLNAGCEHLFSFNFDGKIHPNGGNESAKTTIDKLGLNIQKLCKMRESALKALEDLPRDKVLAVLDSRVDGQFQEFYTTIRQLLT